MTADTPLSRRAILQASAWTVPAIVAVTATPAWAGSGGTIAFSSIPEECTSCRATAEPLTMRLSGSGVGGQLVSLTLSAGWTWARGSGSYISDPSGIVTVPAGDIVAGVADGTVLATWGSATDTATVPLTLSGPLTSTASDAATGLGPQDNTEMVRTVTNEGGAVVVSASTDIWSRNAGGTPWTLVGTGAAIGVDRATFLHTGTRQGAWWLRGGALMFDGSPDPEWAGANAGFTRLYAMVDIGIAVTSAGEVWKYDASGGFAQLGTGAATGPSQLAVAVSPTPGTPSAAVWLRDGELYFDAAPAVLPGTPASGFVRVYSSGGGVVAVTQTGELWCWRPDTGWEDVGTGASTAPGQGTFLRDKDPGDTEWYNNAPIWISDGQLQYADGPGSVADNEGFVRLAGTSNGAFVLAAKADRDLWMWNYSTEWTQVTSDAAPGAGQFAVDGVTKNPYWITPRSSC